MFTDEIAIVLAAGLKSIGAGLAVSAIGGAGIGIGLVFSSLILGTARNPEVKDQLFSYAIFGFALTEAIALFGLMIGFLLMF